MLVNSENLRTLGISYNAAFQQGFDGAEGFFADVAMKVPSTTRDEEYGWLGLFPQVREWLGDRVINRLRAYRYLISNRDFESTVEVERNDIEDDRIGIYTPLFNQLGMSVKEHPDKLVFGLIGGGFTSLCYDGQYFFDTDHPVIDIDGDGAETITSVSNVTDGGGPAWYLLDTSRAVRPILYQERRPFNFVAKDKPTDDNVFFRKKYVYGTDGRCNVGFGFWQLAHASRAPLTSENYEAARNAMTTLRGDHGHRLGIKPTVLLVPMELEGAGRRILNTQVKSQSTVVDGGGGSSITVTGAGSNEWAGSAKLIATPWLD